MALEIERRWLCECAPSSWPREARSYIISQTFLSSEEGVFSRVRKTLGTGDNTDFVEHTRTTKTHVSKGVAEEDEVVISHQDYETIRLDQGDPDRHPIDKVRTVFEYGGRTFEFDQFLGYRSGLYILELEDAPMGKPVELPPWISVSREVTGDVAYSNWSLALRT